MEEGAGRKNQGLMKMLGRFLAGRKRVTEEEIQKLMDAGEEEGLINEEENEMIQSIFALGDTVVREIMVPRTDMVTVGADGTVEAALDLALEAGFSYTTSKRHWRYGFHLTSVVDGNNSDAKLWLGGSIDIPIGGKHGE